MKNIAWLARLVKMAFLSLSCVHGSESMPSSASLQLDRIDGELVYNIKGESGLHVSRLNFPYKLDVAKIGLEFELPLGYMLTINGAIPFSKHHSVAEDFDWIKDESLIYSSSSSIVSKYRNINMKVSKNYNQNINYFIGFRYAILGTQWYDTTQTNLETGSQSFIDRNTLKFKHADYSLTGGINWKHNINSKMEVAFSPYVSIGYANIQTNYLMRDMVFEQKVFPFGAGLKTHLKKSLSSKSYLGIELDTSYVKNTKAHAILRDEAIVYKPKTDYRNRQYTFGIYYKYVF